MRLEKLPHVHVHKSDNEKYFVCRSTRKRLERLSKRMCVCVRVVG